MKDVSDEALRVPPLQGDLCRQGHDFRISLIAMKIGSRGIPLPMMPMPGSYAARP